VGKEDLGAFQYAARRQLHLFERGWRRPHQQEYFQTQCWDTQIDFIERFDLERITTGAEDAFVKYLCHTKNGKSFRNVEYLRIKNGKFESIECFSAHNPAFRQQ